MSFLDLEAGRRIYFEHQQRGPTTVVLSHGWGMSCRVWDNTVSMLNDAGYSTLAYDHRACGQSDKDFADVSIEALGSDLVALCDHLGLAHPILNGWSLGGAVVVDAAKRLGPRLAGLILTAAASPRFTHTDGFPYGGSAADVAGTVTALRADRVNFLHGLYHAGVFAKDVGDAVKNWCEQIALMASPAADASLGALAGLDQRAILRNLQAPALVVIGGLDGVVVPDIGRAAAALIAKSNTVEFADCGHAPFLEDAPRYAAAVLAFLEQFRQ